MEVDTILNTDALSGLKELPDESVNCIVTSPPYWGLRDYGVDGQIGMEPTPDAFAASLVEVFAEARRVLRDDGTLWVNLGDSYVGGGRAGKNGVAYGGIEALRSNPNRREAQRIVEGCVYGPPTGKVDGLKSKDLAGIPWRVAFALQADGWYLRQDIVWSKPNPMPESVTDRCTKAHEYIFLFSKRPKYYFDHEAIKEPVAGYTRKGGTAAYTANTEGITHGVGSSTLHQMSRTGRNKRSVWTVNTQPFSGAHFAVFPPKLIEPCILAGCPRGGVVLDPFFGSGTTGVVALEHGRHFIGIELNSRYIEEVAKPRLAPYIEKAELMEMMGVSGC